VLLRLFVSLISTLLLATGCGVLGSGGGGGGDGGGGNETTTTVPATTTTRPAPGTTTTIPFGTTSSTAASGTTTSTTAEPPPTTLPGPHDTCPAGSHPTCKATFRLKNIVTLGGLQFDVHYPTVDGCFKGIGADVQCNTAPGINALATFNDDDAHKTLSVGLASLAGVTGPTNVVVCDFIGATAPSPTKFRIDVVDAVDPDVDPAVAVMGVTFNCNGGPTTTTVTTPSTTSTTATTLPVEGTEFDVTVRLKDNVTLGGLQIVVDYTQAPGEFRGSGAVQGEGGTLACTALVPSGALAQFNDDDAGHLTMGFVSIGGFDGPTNLVRCIFDRDSLGTVAREDFTITVQDATTPDVTPVNPPPDVAVSSVVAR
jgi:hypothetical protein